MNQIRFVRDWPLFWCSAVRICRVALVGVVIASNASFVRAQSKSPTPLLVNPSVEDFRRAMPAAPSSAAVRTDVNDAKGDELGSTQPPQADDDEPCPEGLICRGPGPTLAHAKSVDVVIPFEFDSDRLTTAALAILRNLATVLREERMRFVKSVDVIGHSDSVGSAGYNKALSQRRAQAVSTALQGFQVSGFSFRVYGYGMERLRNTANPSAAENRRVEFIVRY